MFVFEFRRISTSAVLPEQESIHQLYFEFANLDMFKLLQVWLACHVGCYHHILINGDHCEFFCITFRSFQDSSLEGEK